MILIKITLLLTLVGSVFALSCTNAPPAPDAPLSSGGRIHGIRAQQLVSAGALLLDVRSPQEFASGHIEGALNIPVQSLAKRMSELPQGKQLVVYCRSGRRSATATKLIHQARPKAEVYDLGAMSSYPK
jgi:rhodanese-related sulfurtransferase